MTFEEEAAAAIAASPLLRSLPAWAVPYAQLMRLDKPAATWLLAWPCFWSIALAAPPGHAPDLGLMALFGAGSVLLRGAGCTINDIWDRDIDQRVERTRTRPLARGAVSMSSAVGFLGLQLLLGLQVLRQLNEYCHMLGAASLLLVGTYPIMKRVTDWPQAYLGLMINWGALLGWAAVRGSCDWAVVLPLYASGACWTVIYDTIYGHQDKRDDAELGLKSMSLLYGDRTKERLYPWLGAIVVLQLLSGYAAGCGPLYTAAVAVGAGHLQHQISTVRLDDPADCYRKFASNQVYGALMFAGIVLDHMQLPTL